MRFVQLYPVPLGDAVGRFDLVFQHAAVVLDGFGRADVGLVAGEQHPVDAELAALLQPQPKHLDGVALPPAGGAHAVADVAAELEQPFV